MATKPKTYREPLGKMPRVAIGILIALQIVALLPIIANGGLLLPDFSQGVTARAISDLGAVIGTFLPTVLAIILILTVTIHDGIAHRETTMSVVLRWVLRALLFIWSALVLFPVIWMLYSSLRSPMEFIESPWALPTALDFSNYATAWKESNFANYVFNTVMITGGATVLFFLMLTTTSYILGKYKFKLNKVFNGFYFVAMMIPSILVLVPLYFQLEGVGEFINGIILEVTGKPGSFSMTDNRVVLLIVYAVQALPPSIFLVTGFVRSINNSFLEAAYMDGAGEWYIYQKIILPFIKPIVLFQCLAVFMATWNEYTMAFTFLGLTEEHHTISVGLQHITEIFSRGQEFGVIFAALTISMAPILVLYAIFQKQILNGTDSAEGLK
ncbi:MAG: carbohydrate ABC transporter permease [Clostridia bacterium]|nr:carbohydrate ABC transporter permease [Clostridia bacterium]